MCDPDWILDTKKKKSSLVKHVRVCAHTRTHFGSEGSSTSDKTLELQLTFPDVIKARRLCRKIQDIHTEVS